MPFRSSALWRKSAFSENEFAAGKHVLAVDAQKLLQRFLFAVGKPQEEFIGIDPPVQIDALKLVKAAGDGELFAFLSEVGKVEVVAVEMNHIAVELCKLQKGAQDVLLLAEVLGHPLDRVPLARQKIGAADQVQVGGTGCKTGGFNIYEEDALYGRKSFKGIRDGKVFHCFF